MNDIVENINFDGLKYQNRNFQRFSPKRFFKAYEDPY